ncbi:MAG TPA: ComEC/Rec2 family competence protein [Candidatus Omnitrophota bacterium]|nr:ComEC/Rec2 family competence protein [Candidatus Omnitrophota bacterium]HRY86089.1 ComEC/Rec2 family competence protein [Candidatus Omnitrophota bacterium]
MKLPFFWIGSGFALGIIAERYGPVPAAASLSVLVFGSALLWCLRSSKFFMPLFISCLVCAGSLCAKLDARIPERAVEQFTDPSRASLEGIVHSLPEVRTRGKRVNVGFILKARSILLKKNGTRKLHEVSGYVQVFLLQPSLIPKVGDQIRIFGELSVPKRALNPGEFDYADFLAQKDVRAVFRAIGKRSVRLIKAGNWWVPARIIAETRRHSAALIDRLYNKPQEAAIVKALVLGLRGDVASEVRDQFMRTGTIHLLAISGMNITMIAGTLYILFLFSGLGYRQASMLAILVVLFYIGFSGAGVPIQRAGCGAALALLAVLAGRPAHLLNSLCFAFFIILLWNPSALWGVGFQLSFLCVLSLILILPIFSRMNAWTLSLGSSLAVLAGTFPLALYYFNIFSPVSILANIVAIPLCDAALFTALLAILFSGIPFAGLFLATVSSWMIQMSLMWIASLAQWQWGYWFLERPPQTKLWSYYAILAGILFLWKKPLRGKHVWIGLLGCAWLCVSVSFFMNFRERGFEFTALAAGRNQLAHMRFSNGAEWFLNAGRSFPSDQGEWLAVPYLRSFGARSLEGIVLSDLSKTNTGGLVSIARSFSFPILLHPKGCGYVPDHFLAMLRRIHKKSDVIGKDDEVRMGGEKIRVAAQSPKGIAFTVIAGPWRILVASRWERALWEELSQHKDGGEIHAVFLPSPKSSEAIPDEFFEWLGLARPLLVVSPLWQPLLADRLISRGIPFFDLGNTGALSFRSAGSRLEVISFLKGALGTYLYP